MCFVWWMKIVVCHNCRSNYNHVSYNTVQKLCISTAMSWYHIANLTFWFTISIILLRFGRSGIILFCNFFKNKYNLQPRIEIEASLDISRARSPVLFSICSPTFVKTTPDICARSPPHENPDLFRIGRMEIEFEIRKREINQRRVAISSQFPISTLIFIRPKRI